MAVTGYGEPLILDGTYVCAGFSQESGLVILENSPSIMDGAFTVFRRATFALEGALLDLEGAPLARGGAIDIDVAADAGRSERRCRGAT